MTFSKIRKNFPRTQVGFDYSSSGIPKNIENSNYEMLKVEHVEFESGIDLKVRQRYLATYK